MAEAVIAAVTTAAEWIGSVYAAAGPLGQAAINVALSAGASAAIANNSKPKQRGSTIDLALQSNAPRRLQIGQRCNGGILVDWFVAGTGDPPNTKLYTVVALSQGRCGSLKKVWADGRVMSPTSFPHGTRTVVPDFRSGGDRLWVTYYDGRSGQTADTTLVGLGQGWTSDHKMTGIAYAVIEYQWDSDNMRQPVPVVFEMEGAYLYDRRLDSTAGGSGSHRLDDPDTWTLSNNPRVAMDHYMLGRYLNDVRVFGMGLAPEFIPYDRFEAEANVCDEDVELKAGGTQKRYAANGFLFSDDDYGDAIRRMAVCMAMRPQDFGGRFGLIGPEVKTPVLEINDKHIVRGTQEIYKPKVPWAQNVGGVRGYFCDPQQMYREVDYPSYTEDGWSDEVNGERRFVTKDFEMETDVERAQRLAAMLGKEGRRQATLTGFYPPWCAELEEGDWFVRTGPKWGDDGKVFEVLKNIYNPKLLLCNIVAKEVDPDDSAWDKEVALPGQDPPTVPPTQIPAMAAPTLTVTAITITGATFSKPAVKVAWATPYDHRARRIYIEVTPTLGGTMMTRTVELPTDNNYVIFEDGIVDGVEYSVRARFIGDVIRSVWSSTSTVDGLSPFTIGGEGLGDIVAQLDSNAETIAGEILRGAAWRASREALDFIGGNALKSIVIDVVEDLDGAISDIELIGVRNELGTAWVLNADTVIPAGEGVGSTATSLTALRTQHDQNTADLVFLLESIDGEYAQATLTTNVAGYITGFKFWNGGSASNSAFVILSNRFAIIGGDMTDPQVLFDVDGTQITMLNVKVNLLEANTVITNNIVDNAVTEDYTSTYTTDVTIPSNETFVEVHSASFTNVGSRVVIDVLLQLKRNGGTRCFFTCRLKKNGTTVETRYAADLFPFDTNVPVDRQMQFIQTGLSSGTNTWSVEVMINDGNGGVSGWVGDSSRLLFRNFKK